MDPIQLDEAYHTFASNLQTWVPDGIIEVDLELLESLGILTPDQYDESNAPEQLPHYFHVIETDEKVTLFNHQFVIWIVPKLIDDVPTTIVFIALISSNQPHLEMVFSTAGVYNTPKFVLKLLKSYLSEVIETEESISSIDQE